MRNHEPKRESPPFSTTNLEKFACLFHPSGLRQQLDSDLQRGRVELLLGVVVGRQGHHFLRPIPVPESMCRPHGQLVPPDRVLASPLRHNDDDDDGDGDGDGDGRCEVKKQRRTADALDLVEE